MSVDYTLGLYVDWSGDGDFADIGENVSTRWDNISIKRGRSNVTDEFSPGQMNFTLVNDSGDYSPFNATGPLYGLLLPGRACKCEVTVGATTYPVYYGYLQSFGGSLAPKAIPRPTFQALDAFDILRLTFTNTEIQQNKRVDELLTAILDNISWPVGDRDLNVGSDTITIFTNHNRLAVNALQLAAAQDPGSTLFMGADNKVTYRNRQARSASPSAATFIAMRALNIDIRRDDLFDSIRATYPRYVLDTALSAVWSLNKPRWLPVGTSSFEFEVNASGVLGASGYVTPLVATTDFTANAALDGSGADKTAQVSFTVTLTNSGGGTLTCVNLDSAQVALQTCQVRAYALTAGGELNVTQKDVVSPIVTRQKLMHDFEFLDNQLVIEGWVAWQAAVRGTLQPRPLIEIVPETTAELATALSLTLGSQITLTNNTGLFPSGLNNSFFIESIEWTFAPKTLPRCRLTLFHPDLAVGDMFKISGAVGAGQDYSQLVAAGATTGDRMGY